MTTPPRLELTGLTVDFGVTRALDDVTLSFAPGEIVGLLGHNGAGKSTLINVVTGAVTPIGGSLALDDTPIRITSPRQSGAHGISVIHQTPALALNLSVQENLFIGHSHTGRSRESRTRARRALTIAGGDDIELESNVGALGFGQRQIVDLARGVLRGDLKVLLLDEPTAALGQAETVNLHALIRRVAAQGTTVIYVSHRLPDVVDVCDRVVILREGRLVDDQPTKGLSSARLARALAPDLVEAEWVDSEAGDVVLSIDRPDLQFCSGEVVGLFGVAAGEQFALLQHLGGARPGPPARLAGRSYSPSTPSAAIEAGVHSIAADRDRDGLVGGMSAIDNMFLPWRGRRLAGREVGGSVSSRARQYADARATLDVRGPHASSPISAFSGGNRQKHLLASWLYPHRPRVLLAAQPTQGVDVGAKEDIRRALRGAARDGTCVVVASAESDEIAGLCDRAFVLFQGNVRELRNTGENFDAALLQSLLDLIPAKDSTLA